MVYSSIERPNVEAPDLDALFAALAHPSRRAIVQYLAARPSAPRMHVVASEHQMSPQLLNKHAAALEKSGLVAREGHGRQRHLVLNPKGLSAAQQWIEQAQAFWQHQLDALDAYIMELDREDEPGTDSDGQAT
jgi:DNA-binding transcriptional ArsR family regulator